LPGSGIKTRVGSNGQVQQSQLLVSALIRIEEAPGMLAA
jgi:hypothetical protein